MKFSSISLSVSVALASTAVLASHDFGQKIEALVKAHSVSFFGTKSTLDESSTISVSVATAEADARSLITLARGLKATVVANSPNLGANIDMMALWPNDIAPTHLIVCNEQNIEQVGVQRVNISTHSVEDIISSGLKSCDPVHRTAWGTIVVGEEAGNTGQILEILNPLDTTDITVDRDAGTTSSAYVKFQRALGRISFEGVGIYPNGVTYYGDERRPGNGNGGGAYFKFIPDFLYKGTPVTDGVAAISSLDNSPLASGRVFGLRIGKRSGNTDFGQGTSAGKGVWVEIPPAEITDLALAATTAKLSTYYRPEDLAIDQKALAAGNVRFCGNNTGEDGTTLFYGETFCVTDGTLTEASAITTSSQTIDSATFTLNTGSTPEYQTLVTGFPDFAMMDNIAYQPGKGNWVINEDGEGPDSGRNNDIWSCLDDGADKDLLADACARVMSLNDLNAESTGGVFDGTGNRYFVSIQHNVTGHGVILEINGWQQ